MPTESARVTTAAESRYRIDKPNSRPRVVHVVALDPASEAIVATLARSEWNRAGFFAFREVAANADRFHAAIDPADLVVMVAAAGEATPDVSSIGEACSRRRITTTGLILCDPDTPTETLSVALAKLRPWMLMLVIASSVDYIEDMLRALGA
jgi:hypothetical protein